MCEESIGSENIVRYRFYYKLHADMVNQMFLEYISSGSKAENFNLPGSDFDLIILWKLWKVYEDKP